jgi:hypothetical protein
MRYCVWKWEMERCGATGGVRSGVPAELREISAMFREDRSCRKPRQR